MRGLYEELHVELDGVVPLLYRNIRLADPRNEYTRAIKKITDKKKDMTDADHEERFRLEFFGGLYVDELGRPVVPGTWIEGVITTGAKKVRKGPRAATVICEAAWPLLYKGPATDVELWACQKFHDIRNVSVNGGKVLRCRPMFPAGWKVRPVINFLPDQMNREEVVSWLSEGGRLEGIGDFTPRFGRFDVAVIEGKTKEVA
jgi:hypothetical protein